ncbi:MAG: two-component system response regulator [Candidatus Brocadiia bacterium]
MTRRAKVLIIDDDQDIVAAMECLLSVRDFEVLSATNADEGLRLAREQRPDVVLLDLLMTPRSGIEVYQELRGEPQLRGTKILIVTALKEKIHEDRFAPEVEACWAAEDFFDKPVDPDALVERIRDLVDTRQD